MRRASAEATRPLGQLDENREQREGALKEKALFQRMFLEIWAGFLSTNS